jgi:hypothetical protein
MKLELDANGELEHVLERLADNAQRADGSDATPEDVAEKLLRQAASQRYHRLVSNGG